VFPRESPAAGRIRGPYDVAIKYFKQVPRPQGFPFAIHSVPWAALGLLLPSRAPACAPNRAGVGPPWEGDPLGLPRGLQPCVSQREPGSRQAGPPRESWRGDAAAAEGLRDALHSPRPRGSSWTMAEPTDAVDDGGTHGHGGCCGAQRLPAGEVKEAATARCRQRRSLPRCRCRSGVLQGAERALAARCEPGLSLELIGFCL